MTTESTLPFHPRTGLQALGLFRNGKPIWPALGASEDGDDDVVVSDADDSSGDADTDAKADSSTDDGADDSGRDAGADDDKPLGPKGERALQAEKDRRREADRLRRQAARERDEALAELARLRQAAEQKPAGDDADDKGPDLDAIRREATEAAKAAVKAEVLKDRVSDKIEVLAAKRFQDAGDAVTHLMRSSEIADFLDGDKIDAEAIKEALDELLEKKPYLAVAAQSTRRFQGSGDGGARKGPQKPAQFTKDDLKRMSPEEIVKAQDEGRFDDLLGIAR
ncbi:hypothetical protein [Nonomuraea typhae]|uniref:hypothetical protein n=1 Tax=Nonomuraea typhae TaxID=2603600 RepID=UPI0012F8A129|nr:hypothetical protein [Nonomuraea typhae]